MSDIISRINNFYFTYTEIKKNAPVNQLGGGKLLSEVKYMIISRDVPKCPLCGSPAVLVDCVSEGKKLYTVMCTNPEHCGLGSGFHTSNTSALEAWDNRKEYAERMKAERRERA